MLLNQLKLFQVSVAHCCGISISLSSNHIFYSSAMSWFNTSIIKETNLTHPIIARAKGFEPPSDGLEPPILTIKLHSYIMGVCRDSNSNLLCHKQKCWPLTPRTPYMLPKFIYRRYRQYRHFSFYLMWNCYEFCRVDRTWTCNHMLPRHAFFQLNYYSKWGIRTPGSQKERRFSRPMH